jgi:transglutaminase-like putative cysteine protease
MAGAGGTRFRLAHRTRYAFDRAVRLAPHEVRLRPAPHARIAVERYALAVADPAAHTLHWQQDPHNNWVARLTFPDPGASLVLDVELEAALADVDPFDFFVDPSASAWPFAYAPGVARALAPFLATAGVGGPRFAAWTAAFRASIAHGEPTIALLVRLNRRLRETVDYRVRDEAGVQPAEATLAAGSGSCRDSAWLLAAILRDLGLAARFVSGYLAEVATTGDTHDRASLHAWVEAYVPGAGWIGLDPTSGLLATAGHIPLAAAVDPAMAAPVSGTTEACHAVLDVAMTLTRLPPAGA